jgi:pimeloyl-ACP methyl ester carboxylesterase
MGEGPAVPFLEEMADDYDVIAPAFPGFGESEGIDRIDGIDDAVFHILDLIEALGLDTDAAGPPLMMGVSLGGWMAAEVATRYPRSVRRLVLVNPAGLYIEGHPIGEIFGRDPGDLAEDLFADQSQPVAQLMHQMQELLDSKTEVPFELVKPNLQSMAATAKVAWNPYLHDPKLRRLLYRVTAPTLVVRGAEDRLIPREHGEAYVEGIPDARLVEIAGAGHLVQLEKPGELAGVVRAFLGAGAQTEPRRP